MTITLCLETSGPHCSLALKTSGGIYAIDERLERTHNERLLGMLDGLYNDAGITPAQTTLIGFGCGPGSFTGVRIAASVCQALAMRANALVVPLSSSAALAATALARHETASSVVTAVLSRGDAYYLARYVRDAHGGVLQTREDELSTQAPDWLTHDALIAGQISAWLETTHGTHEDGLTPDARVMLPLVEAVHAAGRSVTAELALPRYFAGDSPWHKRAAG